MLEERAGRAGPQAEFIEELNALVVAELEHGVEAMVGARDLLARLQAQGTPIGLVSNSPLHFVLRSLEIAGLDGTFDVVLSAHEVANPKPAPDPYLEGCRRLGVEPGPNVIALEDSPSGVAAARAAGLTVIGVPSIDGVELAEAHLIAASLLDASVAELVVVGRGQPRSVAAGTGERRGNEERARRSGQGGVTGRISSPNSGTRRASCSGLGIPLGVELVGGGEGEERFEEGGRVEGGLEELDRGRTPRRRRSRSDVGCPAGSRSSRRGQSALAPVDLEDERAGGDLAPLVCRGWTWTGSRSAPGGLRHSIRNRSGRASTNLICWPVRGLWISLTATAMGASFLFQIASVYRSFGNRSMCRDERGTTSDRPASRQPAADLSRRSGGARRRGRRRRGDPARPPARVRVDQGRRLAADRPGRVDGTFAVGDGGAGRQSAGSGLPGAAPDPADGRAKLVRLTAPGRAAINEGRRLIGEIEADWGEAIGEQRYAELCDSLQNLLDELDPNVRQGYRPGA